MLITETNRKWWVAVTCGLTAGLILLDETVVGVALPRMASDLRMTQYASHWVVSAYLLTFAALALAAGRMADIFGPRRVFITGALLFGATSLMCALAQTGSELIAARAVQGVAAAIVFPVAFGIATQAFPSNERATALGVTTAIGGTMLASGPLIGGALTSFISWRYIFFVNVPVTALAILGVAMLVGRTTSGTKVRLDIKGFALMVPGLTLLVFGLMEGPDWPFATVWLVAVLVAGAVLLAVFVRVEQRTEAPLVDTSLFAIPTIAGASLVFFTGQLAKIVVVVFVPLYLQSKAGFSPIVAGLVMVVAVISSPFISIPVGKASDRYGSRVLALAGLSLAALSTLVMAFSLTIGSIPLLVITLFVWGLSLQAMLVPCPGAISRAMPHERQGEAGGISVAARLFGSVLGMAAASAIFAVSNRYDVVLYAALPLMLAGVWVGYRTIEREPERRV